MHSAKWSAAGMASCEAGQGDNVLSVIGLDGGTGAIYASSIFTSTSDVFDILLSIKPIIMAMSGAGTVAGPIVAPRCS